MQELAEGTSVAARTLATSLLGVTVAGLGCGGCAADLADSVEITEVMVASQTGAADRGEWFEIHNRSASAVSLGGVVVEIGGLIHEVGDAVVVPADGYLVFAQSADPAENHMLDADLVYGEELRMGNSRGSLALFEHDALVAQVEWDSTDHRVARSRQLSVGAQMTRTLRGSVWCDSTEVDVYGVVDGVALLGTPGERDAPCP